MRRIGLRTFDSVPNSHDELLRTSELGQRPSDPVDDEAHMATLVYTVRVVVRHPPGVRLMHGAGEAVDGCRH